MTVGILLCAERNDRVVRYALAGAAHPIAVADYTYAALSQSEGATLPTGAAVVGIAMTASDGSG